MNIRKWAAPFVLAGAMVAGPAVASAQQQSTTPIEAGQTDSFKTPQQSPQMQLYFLDIKLKNLQSHRQQLLSPLVQRDYALNKLLRGGVQDFMKAFGPLLTKHRDVTAEDLAKFDTLEKEALSFKDPRINDARAWAHLPAEERLAVQHQTLTAMESALNNMFEDLAHSEEKSTELISELIHTLPPRMEKRFANLEKQADKIKDQYGKQFDLDYFFELVNDEIVQTQSQIAALKK